MPAAGGVPKRLTYHPGNDTALGFTPDGKAVLFSSGREVYTGRYTQLFTVPVGGGFPTRLPIPNASKAQISPDGKTTAYVPLSEPFNQWKRYRGGTTARILLFDNATHAVEQVPQPAGRCNDTDPMWVGGRLLLPVRPGRRVQPLRLRSRDEGRGAADVSRGLPGAERLRGRRPARLRAGRLRAPPRPGDGCLHAPEARRRLRPRRAAPPLGEGDEVDPRRRACRPPARGWRSSSGARS